MEAAPARAPAAEAGRAPPRADAGTVPSFDAFRTEVRVTPSVAVACERLASRRRGQCACAGAPCERGPVALAPPTGCCLPHERRSGR